MEQSTPRCINGLCLLLGYSRQSYYQGIDYIHQKAYESDVIIEEVLRHRKHLKRIGTRKLLDEMQSFLTAHGFKIGRDAMFDLLADRGLLVTKRKRRGPVTTLSKHRFKKYPNIVRDFIPVAPNQLWVSDITYIHLNEGFAYLSLVTDAYSRKIVGFYLSEGLSARGPLAALKMALASTPLHDGLIHHSDRGVQYCCDGYVKLLEQHGVKISMTEKGDPLENALAERVNGILKQELLEEAFPDYATAQKEVAIACSTYNHLRPHGSIDNLKPAQAHQQSGPIKKRWTNYWQKNKGKEVSMA
ncbi:MAG: IS3 family transposase [Chryseotalea sp. WA131a]|nr:MAG: IS3 family transposase [Chryseotalea sp. WA131a]